MTSFQAFHPCARVWRSCAAALCSTFLLLSACAELPQNVHRPVSTALASPAGTPLAALVQERRQAVSARNESGFMLLDGPPAAYGSRLALAEGARKTLDLQYYAIHADASTERLLTAVREAAARGVRVRILLDDFHSTGRNASVMRLAFVPNIEMRMFNPVPGSRGSSLARMFNAIEDASRIQQRMHNKLFIADNVLGVTGGRNLGDAYFGNAQAGNFVDMDVLAAGPIVQDLSRSFDAYWNNERAYPVQSLVTREELDALRNEARGERDKDVNTGAPRPPDGEPRPRGAAPTGEQQNRAWDEQPMDLRTASLVWAPAAVLVDKPAKIPADRPGAGADTRKAPSLVVSQQGQRRTAAAPRGSLDGAVDAAANGDTVVEGLLQMIGQAQRDLLIISPYFVPGPDMKQAFASALARGVKIRVLTNSLASNDAPVAHVGYARHREDLLAMGIGLYELRSEQAGLGSAFGSTGGSTGESRSMLHSKVLVMDGRLLVVGSMNLDLRSQLQNTEIALLIRSDELSRVAAGQIETAMHKGAWRVDRSDGRLVWRAPQDSGLKDSTTEPDASVGLRLLLKLFGPFAPDRLL
ncbi:phospholipase D family protein [Variovorax sp. RA8]|uniref:phospholipase D family protein n=1 Tax=Variovorax sp. (strain JCM 16519 / RA8) TaxID=662548 RepID=UPI001318B49A|nr:phospholipase D family protein [Variovorax sp. RA8]VTU36099.1 putative cardiolipin synthase YwiE [Variovorax sp. RA8]